DVAGLDVERDARVAATHGAQQAVHALTVVPLDNARLGVLGQRRGRTAVDALRVAALPAERELEAAAVAVREHLQSCPLRGVQACLGPGAGSHALAAASAALGVE